ncbi:MAG: hypothetical protein WC614_01575 [bacterium]
MSKKLGIVLISGMFVFSSLSYGKEKEPVVSGCMSFLIPGLGQVYNGQVAKGFSFWGANLFGDYLMIVATTSTDPTTSWLCFIPGLIIWGGSGIWSIVDGVTVANKINSGQKVELELKSVNLSELNLYPQTKKNGLELAFTYKF